MNIYFACSITGGRDFEAVYQFITRCLAEDGHAVPTAHLARSDIPAQEARISPGKVYQRDTAWIRGCDALVAEVSTPSHGVGYEIAFALGLGKPVLCLHQADRPVSKMITGNPDPHLQVRSYRQPTEIPALLRGFLASVCE